MNSLILQEDQAAGLNILVPRRTKIYDMATQISILLEHTLPSQVYMIGARLVQQHRRVLA